MEFGRRDRYYSTTEEEYQVEASTNRSSFTPSSSSSSSSAWVAQTETAEPAAASGPPVEREHMFDKVVTPSDVGKLNRLVIPKQHAEKYFPLDPTSNEKGLLLNFEDRTGKPWRFRYSYWNSSQSYVMTKGWSRFVKEKHLDAGDTVSFGRGVGDPGRGRLFIDWRRRPSEPPVHRLLPPPPPIPMTVPIAAARSVVPPWAASMYGLYFRPVGPMPQVRPVVVESVPVVAEPKRVRLFGVNLDGSNPEEGRKCQRVQTRPPPSPLQWRLSAVDEELEESKR